MARRILEGHNTAYFAGSNYMGSAEQYLQAAVLWLLPDTDLTVRLPQLALSVLTGLLVHRLALACELSPRRALFAAAIFAVGPYFNVYWSVKSRGAYATALLLGTAGLLVALAPAGFETSRRALGRAALFGFICGAAIWANQQAAMVLLPAGWWFLASLRRRPGRELPAVAAVGALGAGLGALPVLWRLATGGEGPFSNLQGSSSSVAQRAEELLTVTIPDSLGVFDDGEPLYAWLPPSFATALAIGAVGAAVFARRRGIASLMRLSIDGATGTDLLLLVLLAMPVLYVQTGYPPAARYLFVLWGVIAVLMASVPTPRSWVRTRQDAGVAMVLMLLVLLSHTVIGAVRFIAPDDGGHVAAEGQVVVNEELGPVVDALVERGERTAYADYWLANPLNWEADGAVLFESLVTRRFPHISQAVESDPSPALVVAAAEIEPVSAALADRGARYDLTVVSGWGLFTGIEPGVHVGWTGNLAEALRGR